MTRPGTSLALVLALAGIGRGADDPPRTRAEATDYVETSRYEDVIGFVDAIGRAHPEVRVETFGRSKRGLDLPLVILSDPPISDPREARGSGKPVVLVMANIHAGEVEGKESALHLIRDVATGPKRHLLDAMILLVAPIYNADGNDPVDPKNRPEQNGPVAGVGLRENADGLDLNRDFMKAQAPETRALLGVFNRWDPHLTIDLHTTNGSYHGYHLTYSIPLNPSVDPRIIAFERDLMGWVKFNLEQSAGYRSYYYGNIEGAAPAPGGPETRTWRAFTHLPRIGQNYVGLRNRLAILSEAYSYLDFKSRVAVTSAFVDAILVQVGERGKEIIDLTRDVDRDATRLAADPDARGLAIESRMVPLPEPVPILVGEVTKVKNPRSGLEMLAVVPDRFAKVRMLDYGAFAAARTVRRPTAYVVRDEPTAAPIVETLLAHGIDVERTVAPWEPSVETFQVAEARVNRRAPQGREEVRITGTASTARATYPAGTFVVRSAQPLGMLAAYLLDPESDDGLVRWDLLGKRPGPGDTIPIARLNGPLAVPTRLRSR